MGPYDRRTIVGLRIKKTLTSAHELEASDGSRLTVAQLLGRPAASSDFNPMRSGNYTSAKATCSAWMTGRERGPVRIPAFRGEVEVRVHDDVLRIAGKHRGGFGMKDGRVKLPLASIVHCRANGSRLELWLRSPDAKPGSTRLQRIALDLFSVESVRELLRWLPDVKPWPQGTAPAPAAAPGAARPLLWVAAAGVVMVAVLVLLVLLRRRF